MGLRNGSGAPPWPRFWSGSQEALKVQRESGWNPGPVPRNDTRPGTPPQNPFPISRSGSLFLYHRGCAERKEKSRLDNTPSCGNICIMRTAKFRVKPRPLLNRLIARHGSILAAASAWGIPKSTLYRFINAGGIIDLYTAGMIMHRTGYGFDDLFVNRVINDPVPRNGKKGA
jgi:hypothetical protein